MTDGALTPSPAQARPGERLLDLVAVMDRLRGPGGCPWDAKQTHASLVEYLVEEAYEAVEAIETNDASHLREELGDVLLQVVFHARIASEAEGWDIDDVARGIVDKLVARHPHVFASGTDAVTADTPEQVEANWHALKAREKGRTSVADGIPAALPALLQAGKIINRSAGITDRLPDLPGGPAAAAAMPAVQTEEDLGDLLFAIVSLSRERGLDAESALRAASRRRADTIRAAGL